MYICLKFVYSMAKFIINGGKKLSGIIEVRGAKNAALKAFGAALLTDKKVIIKNVPEVEDVKRLAEIIKGLGAEVEHVENGQYAVTAKNIKSHTINPEIAKKLRASVVLTAPLLARLGKVKFPHPGGCVIGERPIDVFIDGYKALGAEVGYLPVQAGADGLYEISVKKPRRSGRGPDTLSSGSKLPIKRCSFIGLKSFSQLLIRWPRRLQRLRFPILKTMLRPRRRSYCPPAFLVLHKPFLNPPYCNCKLL